MVFLSLFLSKIMYKVNCCLFCFEHILVLPKDIKTCDNLIMVQEDLAKMGVMIRHYNNKELKGYVRVSVG